MKRMVLLLLTFANVALADTLLMLNKADATLIFVDASSLQVILLSPSGRGLRRLR